MPPSTVNDDRGVPTDIRSKNQPVGPRPKRPVRCFTVSSGSVPTQEMRLKAICQSRFVSVSLVLYTIHATMMDVCVRPCPITRL